MSKIAVHNTETRLLRLETIQLLPGLNFVDKKTFEKEVESVSFWLKAGIIEVKDETEEEGSDPTDIASYSARKAKSLVKETFDAEVLNAWMKSEERVSVVEEIDRQLKRLDDALKKEESKE